MVTADERAIDGAGVNQPAKITIRPPGPSTGAEIGLVIRRAVAVGLAGWAVVIMLGIAANVREIIQPHGSAGVILIPWGMLAIAYFLWKKH